MTAKVYPIVLTAEKEGVYSVHVPDFNCDTQGNDLADAIYMAEDAISLMGVVMQDERKVVPEPSNINFVKAKKDDIKTLVTVDFDKYRKKTEKKVIKKTLTIPSWLNVKAEKAGINFSATLQEALKEKLGMET
jgi:predicted RNase H-like HicB family nuclease